MMMLMRSRLEWLEVTLPLYIEELKKNSTSPRGFLTKETCEALLLTIYSTVACIRYLLKSEDFRFVLTRKFSSDPTESLFGTLRRSLGCNDQLDVRSAISGLEKLLKTGIAILSENSNVLHKQEPGHVDVLSAPVAALPVHCSVLSAVAVKELDRLKRNAVPTYPNLQVSTAVYVGGYIARVVREHVECQDCCSLMTKPLTGQPLQQFTRHQDRGGLLYPSDEILYVLEGLRMFVHIAL
ncbi:hypothetical protein HPB49_007026 [Dermacentor silvarum]|uniref:Uncharacterized protein n=1 Tax=Dermacentor silvarum TaxID=543639 RepID=A0ACB8CW24_DERSI|nr:hypothetical protein HPB49_007026 [Dermacentor silvarum]